MLLNKELKRYSQILEKNPREIVLLRGDGCKWRKCRFCDYHLDYDYDQAANDLLNASVLKQVKGHFHRLEVINSGSFVDLSCSTIKRIVNLCEEKNIHTVYFESHWMHREELKDFRTHFLNHGIVVKFKIGVETFDYEFREEYLLKGLLEKSPEKIAVYFQEACLLQGIKGQTLERMKQDIEIGLKYFERICINLMTDNGMPIQSDKELIKEFMEHIYSIYQDNNRVDILENNTDFGVGEKIYE